MSPFIKRALHWAGSALAVAGIVFVALRLKDYSSQLDSSRFDGFAWAVITGLTLMYGLANTFLAFAWWNLLDHFGATTSRLWAVRVYGLTQLAKYIPGNIMHLAGRQVMGQEVGIPGWSLAKTSVWEIGLIAIAGTLFSVLVAPQFLSVVTTLMAAMGFAAILVVMAVGLKRYVSLAVVRAFGWYVIFLVVSGGVFVSALALTMGESSIMLSHGLVFCGAFVIAWLVGLVTPGAPAGVGVRELVLVGLLKGTVPEADLLMAVLLSRVVTVGGDIFFFLFVSLLSTREPGLRRRCLEK